MLCLPGRAFLRRGGRVRHGVADKDGNVQKVQLTASLLFIRTQERTVPYVH